ncbi:MAG TPA: lamin tail domain-containing protein, partial [Candidatus Moranbacteria bacterium]|nr:lamin tail domain-containing protein [Candidatus Moranbacteria bacterium]
LGDSRKRCKNCLGEAIGNSGLRNSGDRVILTDDSGITIDKMSYGDDNNGLNPPCSDIPAGHSLARHPAGQDSDTRSDFEELSNPNPGTNPHTVVMNEIMPNPIGDDDADMPGGEWIELYNYGEYLIDLKDWKLEDGDGNVLEIKDSNTESDSTTIAAGERLVIYRNGDNDFDLDDDGDEVRLIDEKGLIKDSYAFTETVEGKSIARFPDAVGPWIDPEATPGEENKLKEKELNAFRLKTFDVCFNGKGKIKKDSEEEICAPEFLKYLGMIDELDDEKLNNNVELEVLKLKKEQEEDKLATLLNETKKMAVDEDSLEDKKDTSEMPVSDKKDSLTGAENVGTETENNTEDEDDNDVAGDENDLGNETSGDISEETDDKDKKEETTDDGSSGKKEEENEIDNTIKNEGDGQI